MNRNIGGKIYMSLSNLVSSHGNKEPQYSILRRRIQGVGRSEGRVRHDLEGVYCRRIQGIEESESQSLEIKIQQTIAVACQKRNLL